MPFGSILITTLVKVKPALGEKSTDSYKKDTMLNHVLSPLTTIRLASL